MKWGCCFHYITTRALRAILLDAIRSASAYAISNEAEFIEKVRAASELKREESAKELNRKIKRDRRRSVKLNGIIKKLYEFYATGRLSEKRFETLIAEYEQAQETLDASIAEAQAKLDAFNEDTLRADRFLALAQKYTDFSELTPSMILEFVHKVLVRRRTGDGGRRVPEIHRQLKPTTEELEA